MKIYLKCFLSADLTILRGKLMKPGMKFTEEKYANIIVWIIFLLQSSAPCTAEHMKVVFLFYIASVRQLICIVYYKVSSHYISVFRYLFFTHRTYPFFASSRRHAVGTAVYLHQLFNASRVPPVTAGLGRVGCRLYPLALFES